MTTVMLSVKGQITLPIDLRKKLGIKPHSMVIIEDAGDSILVKPAPDFLSLAGTLGKALDPSDERKAMAKAIAKHGKLHHA